MLAHSDLTEAALGMSLGYFITDIGVITYHFPEMVGPELVSLANAQSAWSSLHI